MEDEKPYWNYEDIGIFSFVLAVLSPILHLFAFLHLLSRSELENPGLGLQFALIVSLILALYLVLKLRQQGKKRAGYGERIIQALAATPKYSLLDQLGEFC